MTRPRKKSRRKRDSNPGSSPLEADALTTRPTRQSPLQALRYQLQLKLPLQLKHSWCPDTLSCVIKLKTLLSATDTCPSLQQTRLAGLVVKASASRASDLGSIPAFHVGPFFFFYQVVVVAVVVVIDVCWLLNVPATCLCVSWTDLLRQFYTEIEVADQTFCLTQSQNTDTGPTSPSADPVAPDAWQGSHWSANF